MFVLLILQLCTKILSKVWAKTLKIIVGTVNKAVKRSLNTSVCAMQLLIRACITCLKMFQIMDICSPQVT